MEGATLTLRFLERLERLLAASEGALEEGGWLAMPAPVPPAVPLKVLVAAARSEACVLAVLAPLPLVCPAEDPSAAYSAVWMSSCDEKAPATLERC